MLSFFLKRAALIFLILFVPGGLFLGAVWAMKESISTSHTAAIMSAGITPNPNDYTGQLRTVALGAYRRACV